LIGQNLLVFSSNIMVPLQHLLQIYIGVTPLMHHKAYFAQL